MQVDPGIDGRFQREAGGYYARNVDCAFRANAESPRQRSQFE